MGEIFDFRQRILRHYKFNPYEIYGIAVSIVAMAFIISFNEWGSGNDFNFWEGLVNFFNAGLLVTLSVLMKDGLQRLWGLAIGYKIEYKLWSFGILFGIIMAFMSNGNIWLLMPAGFLIHHMPGHRLGWFRYGINYFGQAMIALAGPLALLILTIFFKLIGVFTMNPLVEKMIIFNVIFCITSLLPIPPLDGSKIYWGSRMLYAFMMPAIIGAMILLSINVNVFIALFGAFLIGAALWVSYYIVFERHY